MSTSIQIRDLRPEDTEAVVQIAVAAWEPIYAYYGEAMGADLLATRCPHGWQEAKAGQVRAACLGERGMKVCVAEVSGEVVGFASFYANAQTGVGEIGNNAVRPDMQGRGIATAMYEHVLQRMRELGLRFARVQTGGDPAHAPARRAYEKAGFDIRIPHVEYYRKL